VCVFYLAVLDYLQLYYFDVRLLLSALVLPWCSVLASSASLCFALVEVLLGASARLRFSRAGFPDVLIHGRGRRAGRITLVQGDETADGDKQAEAQAEEASKTCASRTLGCFAPS